MNLKFNERFNYNFVKSFKRQCVLELNCNFVSKILSTKIRKHASSYYAIDKP